MYEAFINSSKPDFILEIGKAYVEFAMKQPDYFNFLFNQADINIDLSMKNVAADFDWLDVLERILVEKN